MRFVADILIFTLVFYILLSITDDHFDGGGLKPSLAW